MTEFPDALKAVSVVPPTLESASDGRYTVYVQLSRKLTKSEATAIPTITKGMRGYGNTLEISQTTIEAVSDRAQDISKLLSQAEKAGRDADERAEAIQRRHREREAAQAAEEERLKAIAESIRFD